MDIYEFRESVEKGCVIIPGTELQLFMRGVSQNAIKLCSKMNNEYHTSEELAEIMNEITGGNVGEGFHLLPPFNTDFGQNLFIGNKVIFNAGVKIQDQGGVRIGDGCLLGHNVVITTINHVKNPELRSHRLNPLYIADYAFRDIYMIATAFEAEDHAFEKAYSGLEGWVNCFGKAKLSGIVTGGGIGDPHDAVNHKAAMAKAFELGRRL